MFCPPLCYKSSVINSLGKLQYFSPLSSSMYFLLDALTIPCPSHTIIPMYYMSCLVVLQARPDSAVQTHHNITSCPLVGRTIKLPYNYTTVLNVLFSLFVGRDRRPLEKPTAGLLTVNLPVGQPNLPASRPLNVMVSCCSPGGARERQRTHHR